MPQPEDSTRIFETQWPRLLRLAYRMLGSISEAEDIVQTTALGIENELITRIYITRNPGKLERIRTLLDAAPATPQ